VPLALGTSHPSLTLQGGAVNSDAVSPHATFHGVARCSDYDGAIVPLTHV